ncbi:hypothetical protein ACEPAI_7693 [Sanghuangporus weigelae]
MPDSTLVTFFFFFQIFGGHFGMALILGTVALSKNVKKHPLLVSFLANWVLYSISFCLLLYTGHQFDDQKPMLLCVLQLSMVYGSAISTPLAGLALIFNIWLMAGRLIHFGPGGDLEDEVDEVPVSSEKRYHAPGEKRIPSWVTIMLIFIPYSAYLTTVLFFLVEESRNTDRIHRGQESIYCSLDSNQEGAVPYIVALIVLACVIMEALVVVKLVKFRKTSKWPKAKLAADAFVRLFIRIGILTLYGILSLMAAITFWFKANKQFAFAHAVQAMLPTAAFLIFGTQRDLLAAWGIIPLWNRLSGKLSPAASPDRYEISHASKANSIAQKPLPELPKHIKISTMMAPTRPLAIFAGAPSGFVPSSITISEVRRDESDTSR